MTHELMTNKAPPQRLPPRSAACPAPATLVNPVAPPFTLRPQERARRRSPLTHTYGWQPCPAVRGGTTCPRGDACAFAHNSFETWLHPERYRTQLCQDGASCTRKVRSVAGPLGRSTVVFVMGRRWCLQGDGGVCKRRFCMQGDSGSSQGSLDTAAASQCL